MQATTGSWTFKFTGCVNSVKLYHNYTELHCVYILDLHVATWKIKIRNYCIVVKGRLLASTILSKKWVFR